MRGREAGRFADPDKHARQEQLRERRGQPARGGGGAPNGRARGNDCDPVVAFGQVRNRDRAQHIQQHKPRPAEQAQLKIGQPQFGTDIFLHQ